MTGPLDQVTVAMDRILKLCPDLGLQVSFPKSSIFWPSPHAPPPPLVTSFSSDSGIALRTGALPLLGSCVGLDADLLTAFADEKPPTHQPLFDALQQKGFPVQHALLILRQSALPRMNFLTRTLPPTYTLQACIDFDKRILQTALRLLQIDPVQLSQVASTLLRLPLRSGGLGLRSTASVAPAAYLASIAASAHSIASVPRPRGPALHSASLLEHLKFSFGRLEVKNQNPNLAVKLPTPSRFLPHFLKQSPQHLQRTITTQLDKRLLSSLHDLQSPKLTAHLTSLAQRSASLWLSTIPSRPEFVLHNDHFRLAARLRLSLPPCSGPPNSCACGRSPLPVDHFLCCKLFRRRAVTDRHDSIANFLHHFLLDSGVVSELEPSASRRQTWDRRLRPDLRVYLDQKLLLDVSIAHASADSSVTVAKRALGVASQREAQKSKKYHTLAQTEEAVFHPFVWESTGAVGKSASGVLDLISNFPLKQEFCDASPKATKAFLSRSLAILIQRGNARILQQGLDQSRRVLGPAPSDGSTSL